MLAPTTKAKSGDGGSFALPVANSSSQPMKGLSAQLQVDGSQAAEQRLRTLQPGQSRNVVFSRVKLAPALRTCCGSR